MYSKLLSYDNSTYQYVIDFFKRNKTFILLSTLILLFVYSSAIFYYKIGIDTELMINLNWYADFQWSKGRYGHYLLDKVFPFFKINPVSYIGFIIFTVVSFAVLFDKYKISLFSKIVFVVLYLTSVNYLYSQYFSYTLWAGGFVLLTQILVIQLLKYTKYNYKYFIVPLVLLTFHTSMYQVTTLLFLMLVTLDNIIEYIENNQNIKTVILNVTKAIMLSVFSICMYFLIVYIERGNFSIYGAHMFALSLDFNDRIALYINKFFKIFTGGFKYIDLSFKIMVILLLISYIVIVIKSRNKKYSFWLLLLILFLYLVGFITMVVLSYPARIHIGLSMLYAFPVIMLYYSGILDKLKFCFFIIFAVMISYNAYIFSMYNNKYVLSYQQDILIANRIMNAIYDKKPENNKKHKIMFIGKVRFYNEHAMLRNIDTYGASFFEWDNGNPARIINIMYLLGLSKNYQVIYPDKNDKELKDYIATLPSFPNKDNIGIYKDIIIVKLSPTRNFK